jgi:hypothetical protein
VKINGKSFGFLLAGLVLLPGCMKVPTYHAKPLKLYKNDSAYSTTKQGIVLQARCLTQVEKNCFFDRQIIPLDGVKAIYFSMVNLSNKPCNIAPDGINVLQISLNDIKKSAKKGDTVPYLAGSLAGGWVIALPVYCILCYFAPPTALLVAAGIALPFEGMFIVQGIRSFIVNSRIDTDLRSKILYKKLIIKPGQKYERVIFVKSSDYRSDFTVTMHENGKSKNAITFDVKLSQKRLL